MHNLDYKNLKFKYLIDDITIDLWYLKNSVNIKDIRRYCNSTVNLSKFISNRKILSEIIFLGYNQVFFSPRFFHKKLTR